MIFSSAGFFVFFPVSLLLYWVLPKTRRATFLVFASVFFYMTWSVKLTGLLLFSTTADYFIARWMSSTDDARRRKLLLTTSVVFNMGLLGLFKYANFFLETTGSAVRWLGAPMALPHLDIILPIGISFYTFESMSYTIDVYYRAIKPARSLRDYLFFVAYFPHQIAGPILRARDFLPQVESLPDFVSDNIILGLNLFLLGLMKKVFIADRLSNYVDIVFGNPKTYDGVTTWVAVVAYAMQIYCDFSGYSDMARGIGKTFGFEIMINFRTPYLSENVSEFWQRWHISLSTWLRDYLFTPLGGYRGSRWQSYRNLFITMFLGGLWHGASWNFALWGCYHGSLLVMRRVYLQLFRTSKQKPDALAPARAILSRALVFVLVCFGWVLFRAQGTGTAIHMMSKMIGLGGPGMRFVSRYSLLLIAVIFLHDLAAYRIEKSKIPIVQTIEALPTLSRALVYALAIAMLLIFSPHDASPFIYFQF